MLRVDMTRTLIEQRTSTSAICTATFHPVVACLVTERDRTRELRLGLSQGLGLKSEPLRSTDDRGRFLPADAVNGDALDVRRVVPVDGNESSAVQTNSVQRGVRLVREVNVPCL